MANEKNQTTVPGGEASLSVDRATRAVRDFQAGKATYAFTKDALGVLNSQELSWVSLATRVPIAMLRSLREG